jgi:hypothetical protein
VPSKKVVWRELDRHTDFVKDRTEWKGTDIVFEIIEKNGEIELGFTRVGFVPTIECCGDCVGAWGFFINESLRCLIATGTGRPSRKES